MPVFTLNEELLDSWPDFAERPSMNSDNSVLENTMLKITGVSNCTRDQLIQSFLKSHQIAINSIVSQFNFEV